MRSSSQAEIGVLEKQQQVSDHRPSLFSIGSPPEDQKHDPRRPPGKGYSEFLKECYLCRKELGMGRVYMYGYLGAFCSRKCRKNQIVLDEFQQQRTTSADELVLSVSSKVLTNTTRI
ncbi:Protein INCREASED RESISTANCE TO MYZUS PERSICAE 1 [Linum grandiflorum]